MKVLFVTSSLSRFGGGVATAVESLSRNLLATDTDVQVVGLHDDGWDTDVVRWQGAPATALAVRGPAALGYAPDALGRLQESGASVAHTHGIWMHPSRAVSKWASATGRPYVVSPHGMLDAWAVGQSLWKKRIAGWLYEDAHLRRAGCLHALCDAEARAMRRLGLRNPISVIPNGVALADANEGSGPPPWQGDIPDDHVVMLFLGRLHPKKNLAALIEAWPAQTGTRHWHLVVAGWDQGGHEDFLRKLVARHGLETSVHFTGPLYGEQKASALRHARAFVLPSLSEGLPMAVLEAWSFGLPVLKTDACNLPEGFRACAAARLPSARDEMAETLRAFLETDPSELQEMGRNGRSLVERNFNWPGVAARLREVYAWLADGGAVPATVRVAG